MGEGSFWKPAKWALYSGPMRGGVIYGIKLEHPANPGHPSPNTSSRDCWMGATTTFAEPRIIDKDEPLALRYGLWVHGLPSAEAIEEQFEAFGKIEGPK